MKKVAIAIMSANYQLAIDNTKCILDTWVKHIISGMNDCSLQNEYKVFYYTGGHTNSDMIEISDSVYQINCSSEDYIQYTFEKTIEAFDIIQKNYDFDYIVRTNISTYLNVELLDRIVCCVKDIACAAVNVSLCDYRCPNIPYPRGDFYVMRRGIFDIVMKHAEKHIIPSDVDRRTIMIDTEHVDDVLTGMCVHDEFGDRSFDLYQTTSYVYWPDCDNHASDIFNKKSVSIRVKSCANDTHSGATWDDNDYRKNDIRKMRELYEIYNNGYDFNNVDIQDVFIKDNESKKIVFVRYYAGTLQQLKSAIK